jgi:hypothetical protein
LAASVLVGCQTTPQVVAEKGDDSSAEIGRRATLTMMNNLPIPVVPPK